MLKDLFCFIYIYLFAKFMLHAGYCLVVNTAGYNVFKVIQIGVYIECQPVHGNPAAATHTHGADLSFFTFDERINPYPGFASGERTPPQNRDPHRPEVSGGDERDGNEGILG